MAAITAAQIDTFADLLAESRDSVGLRLHHDPELVPVAVAAANARQERQRSGRNWMIAGFTLVGLGATVWVLMTVPIAPPAEVEHNATADAVFAVSAVLGLAAATYGIIKVAVRTDAETEAVRRYRRSEVERPPAYSPEHFHGSLRGTAGGNLGLSLLSFTF